MGIKISNSLLESLMDAWFASALSQNQQRLGEYICKQLGITDVELLTSPDMESTLSIIGQKYLVE